MPPDPCLRRLPEGPPPKLFDRTIPLGNAVKTLTVSVFAVNIQIGPLLAAPCAAVVLRQEAELLGAGLAALLLLLGATRRSHLAYRRIRME